MSCRRPSNASSRVSGPWGPISARLASTSTMGRRRRAAAIASPSRVCAFSRTRSLSSSAWKVARSTAAGRLGALAALTAGSPRFVGSSCMTVSLFPATPIESGRQRSGALTFVTLSDQFLYRTREGRLEVDQLRPCRHRRRSGPCRRRANAPRPPTRPVARASSCRCRSSRGTRPGCPRRRPAPPVRGRAGCCGGCTSVSIVRATVGLCRRAATFAAFFGGAHDDRRAIPCEPDRDGPRRAVLGDVGQAGQIAGQELLADRAVQDIGNLARLHGEPPSNVVLPYGCVLRAFERPEVKIFSLGSSWLFDLDCLAYR